MEIRYPKKRRKKNKKNSVLNVFETTFACLIVFLALFVEISCQNVKYKALKETLGEEPTEPVSKSISDVINEFYIKNNIDFDFIIYGNNTNHINDVINELKNFPATIQHIPDFLNWNHKLNRSAIFFINSLTEVQYLHVKSIQTSVGTQFTNLESRNFKFLVYIKNAGTFEFVDNKTQTKKISKLTLNLRTFSDLMFYEFLLFNDGNRIILAANVFYSEKKCAKSHLRKLNSFDLETQKWNKKLENFDHYANFHGCIISFIMQIRNEFYVKDFKNISALNERFSDNGLKFSGVFYTFIEKLAVKHNFTIQYWIYGEDINLYTKNYKTPPLLCLSFLKITRLKSYEFPFHYDSKPLYTYDFYFLISLNDLYTNYEKLSFPFDTKTWILIFLTFSLTFTSIFGLHFSPRWLRTIVFGKGIDNPAYNALGIFFGIAQMRLPNESFCRAIFIIYLWYCLIIRTCWQSKMFEFITTDMRKPLPESIEDLIKMDYKVRTTYGVPEYEKILNGREGPEFYTEIYSEEYDLFYEAVLNGSIKSKYAFLIHTEDHARLNSTFKKSLPIMKNERLTKTVHISMMRVNIISQPLDDVIDELIPSGILQHENDYGMWYMHRPVDVEVKDPKRILSMSDLEFGFVTFLGVLSLSIVVFICELHALYVRRQLRKLLGLYEFIRVIRERFKDYHDRW